MGRDWLNRPDKGNALTMPMLERLGAIADELAADRSEYVIMVLGKSATTPFDDDDEHNVYWEHEVEVGGAETVEFTAPTEPGDYQIVCGIAGHLEQGMQGTLTVK